MSLFPLLQPVAEDMRSLDALIRERLHSDVALINQLSAYIIGAGGKRLRPALVLLAARASGYTGKSHLLLAAVVEFIHTATLLHDDVVDHSGLRRGRETANELWGNAASVLTGDFLYSRAFQMMVELNSMHTMQCLADTTNTIAEGEVLQLLNCGDANITEARYNEVVWRKTAILFQAGAQLGARLGSDDPAIIEALRSYGLHLGVAFQLVDDALDYTSDAATLGKNVGDDLAEGKPTLPLIHALRNGSSAEQAIIRNAIEQRSARQLPEILKAIESCGAIAYTAARARDEVEQAVAALGVLPDTPCKATLEQLAWFAIERTA